MTDVTRKLPLELLTGILEHVSIPDVLRFRQVNRAFHDAILASPLIQHKIDLFAAGFEYNAAAGINLADSRKAFLRHCSSLKTLHPIEERRLDDLQRDENHHLIMAGGVYAIILRDSVRLLTLGSASRGIPYKEWEIPIPVENLVGYGFYPVADVIAFVHLSALQAEIHLRTLSKGEQYPAAQPPVICYPRNDIHPRSHATVLLTGSRLLVLMKTRSGWRFVIWDWKNAQILLEFDQRFYSAAEFIDDYRLLVCVDPTSDAPASIVLINTGEFVGGVPLRTTFKLSHYFGKFADPPLLLERGTHSPSPAESLAPFCQDPAQRVVALVRSTPPRCLVFRVKTLMDILEPREGSEIGWDEWKNYVVIPSVDAYGPEHTNIFLFGCRLFSLDSTGPGPGSRMKAYDFSMGGRAKCWSSRVDEGLGVTKRLSSTGAVGRVPWELEEIFDTCGGHDSLIFDWAGDNISEGRVNLHIWTF